SVLFNLYLLAIGFDIRFIGLRLVIEGVASAVTAIPAGLTSDRIGRKLSLVLGDGMGAVLGLIAISTRSEAVLLMTPAAGAFFSNLHPTAEPAFMAENSKPLGRFTPEAMQALLAHRWPGNVRELENCVERAVVLSSTEEMGLGLLPDEIARPDLPAGPLGQERALEEIVNDYERRVILDALDGARGSQTDAARVLRVPLSTLNQKIKRLGISVRRNSSDEGEDLRRANGN
ncbi:MAG: hypothetical protein IH793_07915, partial [Acidobacteria bacterium]|nr:hypothetical protein [Acidobacteriota bacterium]